MKFDDRLWIGPGKEVDDLKVRGALNVHPASSYNTQATFSRQGGVKDAAETYFFSADSEYPGSTLKKSIIDFFFFASPVVDGLRWVTR